MIFQTLKGLVPRALTKNLIKICRLYNDSVCCQDNEENLRQMTYCSVKQAVHNGVQLTLHIELSMLRQEKAEIFQLQTIPIFHKNTNNAYQLNLKGKKSYNMDHFLWSILKKESSF